ncbi:hypothetical protein ACJJTC_000178 [Scirpophaga incertulas]
MFQCVQPLAHWGAADLAAVHPDIRVQLTEHARALERRMEAASGAAAELYDYCRRRAELEYEYSRALDKLAQAATQRLKDHRRKREKSVQTAACGVWQAALGGASALARDHGALADLYCGSLAARVHRAAEDVLRLHRKCRDIVSERQEEVGGAVREAAAAGKAAAAAGAEWRAAALKLRRALLARAKLPAEPSQRKLRACDRDLDKVRHACPDRLSSSLPCSDLTCPVLPCPFYILPRGTPLHNLPPDESEYTPTSYMYN